MTSTRSWIGWVCEVSEGSGRVMGMKPDNGPETLLRAKDLRARADALRAAWNGEPPIQLDDEIDGVTLRDLLAKDEAIRENRPTNYLRLPLTTAQRDAVSRYKSAQLRFNGATRPDGFDQRQIDAAKAVLLAPAKRR